jgi:hypothetical protein
MKQPKDILRVAGMFKTYHPLVDGSMNLTFSTQEVDKPLIEQIIEYHRQFGHLLFSPNIVPIGAVPEDDARPTFGQSPSLKLKNTIYALYMELGAPYGKTGFQKFYEERIERLRGEILGELNAVNQSKNR